jgi:hypothetical protein
MNEATTGLAIMSPRKPPDADSADGSGELGVPVSQGPSPDGGDRGDGNSPETGGSPSYRSDGSCGFDDDDGVADGAASRPVSSS